MSPAVAPQELTSALWDLAAGARWFSGRSRGATCGGVTLGAWIRPPEPGPGMLPALLHVDYPSDPPEVYFIPLVLRRPEGAIAPELSRWTHAGVTYSVGELADDAEAAALLLPALAAGEAGFTPARPVPVDLPARRYAGEQSNTTLFFGDQLLAKVFRRLEAGPNPDVELHSALADTGDVASLYGVWRNDETDLAIFLEALPKPRDGYVLACEHAAVGADFTHHAHALGAALARIHHALADRLATGSVSLPQVAQACLARFDAAAREIADLESFRALAETTYGALGSGNQATSRIHGDCHLGQVLLTGNRWVYVDFEGEPLKTIAERRQPDTPWRDVAGMLRSFDYAAASTDADTDIWLAGCRRAFLEGYGASSVEQDPLLRALELDKAVYEVVYESRNRPAWRQVPIDFLESLKRES